jgi:hypothetical protein
MHGTLERDVADSFALFENSSVPFEMCACCSIARGNSQSFLISLQNNERKNYN